MAGRCGPRGTVAWLLLATLVIEVLKLGGGRGSDKAGLEPGVGARLQQHHQSVDVHEGIHLSLIHI